MLDSRLHDAIIKQNLSEIKYLVEIEKVDINAQDTLGRTALYFAAFNGHPEVVDYLLTHGAQCDIETNEKVTVLAAVLQPKKNTNIPANNQDQYNKIILSLIKKGATAKYKNGDFQTALYIAVNKDQFELAKEMLTNPIVAATINTGDVRNMTPLFHAARKGDIPMMQLLLKHGANIEAPNEGGITPIQIAIINKKKDAVKYLIENKANITTETLIMSLTNEDTELMQYLIEVGNFDINCSTDNNGMTLLHQAVLQCSPKMINFLLTTYKDKININAQDSTKGNTPLHYAVLTANLEIVKCLDQHNADLLALNKDENPPFMHPFITPEINNYLNKARSDKINPEIDKRPDAHWPTMSPVVNIHLNDSASFTDKVKAARKSPNPDTPPISVISKTKDGKPIQLVYVKNPDKRSKKDMPRSFISTPGANSSSSSDIGAPIPNIYIKPDIDPEKLGILETKIKNMTLDDLLKLTKPSAEPQTQMNPTDSNSLHNTVSQSQHYNNTQNAVKIPTALTTKIESQSSTSLHTAFPSYTSMTSTPMDANSQRSNKPTTQSAFMPYSNLTPNTNSSSAATSTANPTQITITTPNPNSSERRSAFSPANGFTGSTGFGSFHYNQPSLPDLMAPAISATNNTSSSNNPDTQSTPMEIDPPSTPSKPFHG